MSRERARARAAREAAVAAEREQAARARGRRRRVEALRPPPPRTGPRRPRYGAMPLRTRLGLAGGWAVVQFLGWQVLAAPAARLGLALLSLFALPLVVTVFVPSPTSRSSR